VIIGLPEGNLLIDTPPDLRTQLLRERIGIVHAVAYTHAHADHLFGLDDLRLFPFYLGHPVPLYCEPRVERRIRHSYDYAFDAIPRTHPGAAPRLEIRSISLEPFSVLGAEVIPLRLQHGPNLQVLGFRIGDFAYCTDTNQIADATFARLAGVRTFVIDALRPDPHPTHFSLDQAIAAAQRVGAEQTWLTHSSHELDYEATNQRLPPGIAMAYDGLRTSLDIQPAV
jgi:phosphoribosyl 1,2-cyclic phosphate phosphodiesterase